jgi:predicted DNA-binding transcriptional regulator YafY
MNRIDRLFAILLQLQSKKRIHSKNLASAFGVSERTIFRDIVALSEIGVPITTEWGEGYSLLEGFYLPPLIFTPDEASALFLGARMFFHQAAGKLSEANIQALAKLEAILPKMTRDHVEELAETIRFLLPERRFNLDDERLIILRRAIKHKLVIEMTYHSFSREETTRRKVEPFELIYGMGTWYIRGYCQLREDVREFRIDRIDALHVLDETFTLHKLEKTVEDHETVRLQFSTEDRRWVDEYQNHSFQGEETLADGSVVMTYHPHRAVEMRPWILMWGARVNILEPLALRVAIREEALHLAKNLT